MTMKDILYLMDPTMLNLPLMMIDYAQFFVFVLYWLRMKLYGFANFVEQHLVPYEYASINSVIIEASKWLL